MNLILLSGGSGKRLWPLSNDVRSKQFLKLFKNGEGEYESLLQRVHRQLVSVAPHAHITVATGRSQAGTVKHQLGEQVSLCVEPCRRDTLPAIALTVAYLHDEKGLSNEETVVVCPVDPYVDDSYFASVARLHELATRGDAALTLMGIVPTYASEKYGYIVPETADELSRVDAFHEKPDRLTAAALLRRHALWNAGIFAFRVGYLLDKAHELFAFDDYRDLYNKYDKLEAVSFDYAVAERETSAQVLRYSGTWKDVGTWNMMAEVMTDRTLGPVTLDEACANTHVINELNLPILCMGCRDMVVAASGDGILIADKDRSSHLKTYAERLITEVRFAEKSWGTYRVVDVQPGAMTVKISIAAGRHMSYHLHNYRDEVWTVTSGRGRAIIDGMEQELHPGDVVTIAAGCRHTVCATSDMNLIEVQVGEEISPTDKVKYELDER